MMDVYSKARDNSITVNRVLGKIEGSKPGSTVVFFGGIHGNETSGVFALKDVLETIDPLKVKGTVYGISGNLKALQLNQRYADEDLNRLWTKERIEAIKKKTALKDDEAELLEILGILNTILETEKPPFYFIDLHTTSSKTLPFITINDALINRKFAKQFPVPIVLGIEEYLNGPLLSYINKLGYVSLGFESGQHEDLSAITNNIAFIYLALVFSGVLKIDHITNFLDHCKELQTQAANMADVFEVIYLHKIQSNETFTMINGFKSFQAINKGIPIAISNRRELKARYNGRIFMPLYQTKGSEGFFIIRRIKPFYLKLSTLLRRTKFDNLLVALPGVSWLNKTEGILQVNLRVAKFFAKSFFHLLGYRNKQITKTHLRLNNRERVAKTSMYKKEPWY
ncbi:succinylglutamate desuccinylase/aspartoacylase family protein [Flavivirga spongiicola]|uniref:Succinylglutamate desuccinylase/aspartoacylase family protein n=1 Tax=Flavivirga spongiicola TaxID=421621 RepID=A0ABU7XT34_9FLAO|nr:succinylglutamate desuccinylase/aspartoacylase family protein [Flavivirga sp. MEBiC05379]MDO5978926.1 succinylglutamate desuccinylase/aspartoacylase family protein [Flavivirga sp. MEBiC05379]